MKTKIEWRSAIYMLVWVVLAYIMKCAIGYNFYDPDEAAAAQFFGMIFGIFTIVMALVISFMEKWDNLPFLWWKVAPTENWAIGGLGVFGNSASVAAIGIVVAAPTIMWTVVLYVAVAAVMLAQRYFLTKKLEERRKACSGKKR